VFNALTGPDAPIGLGGEMRLGTDRMRLGTDRMRLLQVEEKDHVVNDSDLMSIRFPV
jgi:hypothetical protein